jgi:hypothetical protein
MSAVLFCRVAFGPGEPSCNAAFAAEQRAPNR